MPRLTRSKSPRRSRKSPRRSLPLKLKLWNKAREELGVAGVPRHGTAEYKKVKALYKKLCKKHC